MMKKTKRRDVVTSHPAVLDGFIDMVRKEIRENDRPSVMNALKTAKSERPKAAPAPKHEAER